MSVIAKIGPTVSAQLILLINPKIIRFIQCFSEHWCVCQPPDFVHDVDNTQTLRPAVTWGSVLQRVCSLNPTTKQYYKVEQELSSSWDGRPWPQ